MGAAVTVAESVEAPRAASAGGATPAAGAPAEAPAPAGQPTAAERDTFGSPGWVAPNAGQFGDPTEPGPRVAERDRESTGETILRAPFRLVFLPVRWVARGTEALVSWVGPWAVPQPTPVPERKSRGTTIGPALMFKEWTGLQAGLAVTHRFDPLGETRLKVQGTYSTRDHRELRARQIFERADGRLGLQLEGRYRFRPTSRFYGVGNQSSKADRSIYLDESGRVEAVLRVGRSWKNNVSVIASYLESSARTGYNDSPGVRDVFPEETVDQLFGRSQVFGLGLGAELQRVNDMRDPSAGVHGIVEVRQYRSVDGGGLDYREWHTEARAYVPVFSHRRVLAFRAVHENVDPMDDSAPIPVSLMPDPAGDVRFKAYSSHRFRDRHLIFGQLEYRWLIWQRLWALGLAQIAQVANDSKNIRIADVHESYGGGFRYAIDEETTGRLEIAGGSEGVKVYFTLSGTF